MLIVLSLLWEVRSPMERRSGLELQGFRVSAKPAFSFNLAPFTGKLKGWGGGGSSIVYIHCINQTNRKSIIWVVGSHEHTRAQGWQWVCQFASSFLIPSYLVLILSLPSTACAFIYILYNAMEPGSRHAEPVGQTASLLLFHAAIPKRTYWKRRARGTCWKCAAAETSLQYRPDWESQTPAPLVAACQDAPQGHPRQQEGEQSLKRGSWGWPWLWDEPVCGAHSPSPPGYSTGIKQEAGGSDWQAGKVEAVVFVTLWKDTGKWLGRSFTPVSCVAFPSLLPSSATFSTAWVKAGRRGKMQSITFHSIVVPLYQLNAAVFLMKKLKKAQGQALAKTWITIKLHLQRSPYKEI